MRSTEHENRQIERTLVLIIVDGNFNGKSCLQSMYIKCRQCLFTFIFIFYFLYIFTREVLEEGWEGMNLQQRREIKK